MKSLLVVATLAISATACGSKINPDGSIQTPQGTVTAPTAGKFEQNTDRAGNDIADMPVGNDPALCAAQCDANAECTAWTWVRPGAEETARCFLKNPTPEPGPAECCVSGVKGM